MEPPDLQVHTSTIHLLDLVGAQMSADAKTKKRTSQDKIVPADSVGDGSGKFADWQQLRHNAEPPSLKSDEFSSFCWPIGWHRPGSSEYQPVGTSLSFPLWHLFTAQPLFGISSWTCPWNFHHCSRLFLDFALSPCITCFLSSHCHSCPISSLPCSAAT